MVPTDSPGLNYDDLTLCVYSDGNTSYGTWYDSKITNSYGMEHSPYVNKDQLNVNSVLESGFLNGYACWSSYGTYLSPGPGYDNDYVYMYVIYPGGYTDSVSVVHWDCCGITLSPRKTQMLLSAQYW